MDGLGSLQPITGLTEVRIHLPKVSQAHGCGGPGLERLPCGGAQQSGLLALRQFVIPSHVGPQYQNMGFLCLHGSFGSVISGDSREGASLGLVSPLRA